MAGDRARSVEDLERLREEIDKQIEERNGGEGDEPRSYSSNGNGNGHGTHRGLVQSVLIPVQVDMGRGKNLRIYMQVDAGVTRSQRRLDAAIAEIEGMNRDFEVKMWEPREKSYGNGNGNGYGHRGGGGNYHDRDRNRYSRD